MSDKCVGKYVIYIIKDTCDFIWRVCDVCVCVCQLPSPDGLNEFAKKYARFLKKDFKILRLLIQKGLRVEDLKAEDLIQLR